MVLVQRKYACSGVLLREVEEYARIGTAKPINCLIWIADHRQVLVAFDNLAKQPEFCVGVG